MSTGRVVPDFFGDVGQCRDAAGGIGSAPERTALVHEFRTTHGGHLRNAAGSIHGQAILGDRRAAVSHSRTRSRIAGGSDPRHTLRVGLLRRGLIGGQIHQIHLFAHAIDHADDRRHVLIDGVKQLLIHIGRIDEDDGGIRRHPARPVDVQIRLVDVAIRLDLRDRGCREPKICWRFGAGILSLERNAWISEVLMSDCPTIAIICPVPSMPA